jgi:hypothetical protein
MKYFSGVLFAGCLLAAAAVQGIWSGRDLERDTLRRGRIALSSGDFAQPNDLKNRDNSVRFLLDGDLSTHTQIYFPSSHPEGTHLIAELGLSHLPGSEIKPLRPVLLRIHQDQSGRFSTIRRARISILTRRANDPDRENVIPPTQVIWEKVVDLERVPAADVILDLPPAARSGTYPENVFLIIAKIQVLEVYEGEDRNRVAVSELEYLTETADGRRITFTAIEQQWKL